MFFLLRCAFPTVLLLQCISYYDPNMVFDTFYFVYDWRKLRLTSNFSTMTSELEGGVVTKQNILHSEVINKHASTSLISTSSLRCIISICLHQNNLWPWSIFYPKKDLEQSNSWFLNNSWTFSTRILTSILTQSLLPFWANRIHQKE